MKYKKVVLYIVLGAFILFLSTANMNQKDTNLTSCCSYYEERGWPLSIKRTENPGDPSSTTNYYTYHIIYNFLIYTLISGIVVGGTLRAKKLMYSHYSGPMSVAERQLLRFGLVINSIFVASAVIYSSLELLTHHQKGNCGGSITFIYPQFAIPIILLGLLVIALNVKRVLQKPSIGQRKQSIVIVILSLILYLSVLVAVSADNFCIPF